MIADDGTCTACGHLRLWHGKRKRQGQPCLRCDCPSFTPPGDSSAAAPSPLPGQISSPRGGSDLMAQAKHAFHLDVTCPSCAAGFSQPCRSSSGAPRRQVHKAREHAPAVTRWVQPDLFTAAEGT